MLKIPTSLLPIVSIFARPLGTAINTAIVTASTAFVTWSTAHGMEAGTATTVAAGLSGVIFALIQWAAATQGVNIAVINSNPTNGVRVVEAAKADAASVPAFDPAKGPPSTNNANSG